MKLNKIFFAGFLGLSLAFAMTACNNNAAEETVDSTAIEMAAPVDTCAAECSHNCQDSTCAADNCANCTKKGTDQCCKKNGKEGCAHEGEGCAHEGEGCAHKGCQKTK